MCKSFMNSTNVSSTVILHNDVDREVGSMCNFDWKYFKLKQAIHIKLHKHKYAYSDRHTFAHP